MCDLSECHHKRPERIETDRTWKILKYEYDSCFLSCKPLLRSTLNCSHQLAVHSLSQSALHINIMMIIITQRSEWNNSNNQTEATIIFTYFFEMIFLMQLDPQHFVESQPLRQGVNSFYMMRLRTVLLHFDHRGVLISHETQADHPVWHQELSLKHQIFLKLGLNKLISSLITY